MTKDEQSRLHYGIRKRWQLWLILLTLPITFIPAALILGIITLTKEADLGYFFRGSIWKYLLGGTYDPNGRIKE